MSQADDELLAELGEAVRARAAVPASFIEAGKAAFTWRRIDAELAELAFDSADPAARHGGALAGTRAEPAALRALTFVAGDLSIEIEVTDEALLGQLVPPQPGEVTLHGRAGGPRTVAVDDVGWFAIRPVPSGTIRLHVEPAGGAAVLTEWITL